MSVAALIVAAGRGSRAAAQGEPPKQYADLAGQSVLERAIAAFASHDAVTDIVVVIHPDDQDAYRQATVSSDAKWGGKLGQPVSGGESRQASVLRGLEALAGIGPDLVLIHDAARPFVSKDVIDRVLSGIGVARGAVSAVPLSDTLKRAEPDGRIIATVERSGLFRAQTPQGFAYPAILAAHQQAASAHLSGFTDDAAIAEWAGLDVVVVQGSERNHKLTTAEDIDMARALMTQATMMHETRTGTGFDVHRFASGDSVWLCGVEIPHSARLDGHSDADVGLHALTDALLGAIGAGDIGQHFPPSDMQWKGAASHVFLSHAAGLVAARNGRIVNVDVTILAEEPRIGPHRRAMCERIAAILAIDADRVSVKATTTEGLGFTGRREGIAAMAAVSIELPRHTAAQSVPQRHGE